MVVQGSIPVSHRLEVGMNLYYEVVVDNQLQIRTDVRHPMRGQSAFQTDLCLVECITAATGSGTGELAVPRVVFEFKLGMTAHDVLTYSAKARKHKVVYPYLRYGIVVVRERSVPRKFFVHNEALDFCVAIGAHIEDEQQLARVFGRLIASELDASKRLEQAAFGKAGPDMFRSEVVLGYLDTQHAGSPLLPN